MATEPVAVTLQVIDVLDELGVPYAIGGSLASAWHGFSRTTIDSDIIAVLQLIHVQPFVQALKDEFYVDEGAMRDAISRRSSFNLIHLRTMFKVDIFVPKSRPFDRAQLANRRLRVVAEDPDRTAFVMGAEDTVLASWSGIDSEERPRNDNGKMWWASSRFRVTGLTGCICDSRQGVLRLMICWNDLLQHKSRRP